MTTLDPDRLYHIVRVGDWPPGPDDYGPASLASEGFIHLSAADQVEGTLRRHYAGQTDLLLLTIDPHRLTTPVRWEAAAGGYGAFPHLYGSLNADAVVSVDAISDEGEDGTAPCHHR